MSLISPEEWSPRGISDLEPQAWQALRQIGSACVVAGPGAGKTEFLAQKAAYLLETGLCPAPYRILAISFKTDAARNLADRVRERCPSGLSNRFVSMTFDAFTKGIVDRFLNALPANWRPTNPYDVAFPASRTIRYFLDTVRLGAPKRWQHEIAGLSPGTFESHLVGSHRLPSTPETPSSAETYVISEWWHGQLRGASRSSLSFVSINRLAELLIRTNVQLRRALQATYQFVFVDEFQDTTFAQYDFLQSAFLANFIAVTAVGDNKQRIMVWAGARPDAFVRFAADFGAPSFPLTFNFRSSPDLVRIQHVVALALDGMTFPSISQAQRQVDGDVAQVWNSPTKAVEIEHLVEWLGEDMRSRKRLPRDYALLVRQKADEFEADLNDLFHEAGLYLRNESHTLGRTTLQDLLSDDLCEIVLGVLKLAAFRRDPKAWRLVATNLAMLRGVDPDDEAACLRADAELTKFLAGLRREMVDNPTEEDTVAIADRVLEFLDLSAIARAYPPYATGELLEIMVEAFKLHLAASASSASNWAECVEAFEGRTRMPLMTVHKSKGLEYDTIVFIGLDDDAWWSHTPGNPEGLATFFVALSRAKQRAIFCFCRERGGRKKVAELYQLLTAAGVPEVPLS